MTCIFGMPRLSLKKPPASVVFHPACWGPG